MKVYLRGVAFGAFIMSPVMYLMGMDMLAGAMLIVGSAACMYGGGVLP